MLRYLMLHYLSIAEAYDFDHIWNEMLAVGKKKPPCGGFF